MIDKILLSCQKSCQHYTYVNILLIELLKSHLNIAFVSGKPHEYDRSERLSERKHKTFLQLMTRISRIFLVIIKEQTSFGKFRITSKSSDLCHNHEYIQLWELRN